MSVFAAVRVATRRRVLESRTCFGLNQYRLRLSSNRNARAGGPVRAVRGVGDRLIALSYDDGPSPANTPILLDLLRNSDASATFFVVGSEVAGNEQLIARVLAEGHELGNHSFTHSDPLDLDGSGLREEIERCGEAISRSGQRARLFRPPYGKRPSAAARICAGLGMQTVLWSIDSGDSRSFAVEKLVAEVVRRARPGDIVLMHDGGEYRPRTIEATRRILSELTERGYSFVTVSQMLAAAATR